MKIAWFDCSSGISGDMILGAMVDAGVPFDKLKEGLSQLNLEGYSISANTVLKKGVKATKVDVVIESPDLPGRPLKDLRQIISDSNLSQEIKTKSLSIFQRLAVAESVVHNCPVEDVHFHEVGHIDTIVDIVGSVYAFHLLGIDKVISSPVDTGSGTVKMSHGIFPIPAPVTAELLKDVPVYSSGIERELTTPTGAAIITAFASSFQPLPKMTPSQIGYGAGGWELSEKPNILRVFIGEDAGALGTDEVCVIETNIDDMNPQIYEYLMDRLFEAGALDVYITPIIMKKNRPAQMLSVIADTGTLNVLREIIFRETTSIGVRVGKLSRFVLARDIKEVQLPYGRVRIKISGGSNGVHNIVPEYEDCKALALKTGIPLKDIIELARRSGRE
ncbi:MAG: nickel pincer cofactor biosynthesis protein LarC [Nitrospirae bacterium]|nr:nickel pincer cofactor biosynthesis protein LarC [Nitrospirota bacterium]